MTFLLTNRPNWIIPVFRQTGFIIEYKRFPADYMWRGFLDLSSIVFDPTSLQDQIDVLTSTDEALAIAIGDVGAATSTAQSTADAALANAATAQSTADTAIGDASAAQSTADAAYALAAAASPIADLPDCAYLIPAMFRTISGGFTTPTLQANQWTHAYADMVGSGSIADAKILLAAGNYDYSLGYVKTSDSGNLALKIDGTGSTTSIPSMYNATTLLAQIVEGQLISSLSAGLHTIRLEITGKNPSSSGFHCRVSYLAIRKRP